ncbi:trigger factor [Pelodictyon luteolum DSM 273]|uniref:Trigger factor n=1 Tax=Chlorobium luteolum (strain DSM 273 / BCRC 81028 / 2530) TaxID=319225 RepID=Q3B671_CHLL3|nr:trigger factor [Pelodictyon luteolum DSM 273]
MTIITKPQRALQKNIKNISETEQELEIIFTSDEFANDYEQELEEAKKTVQLKGFRKGHAPAGLIRKLAGPAIEASIAEKLASKHFGDIVESDKIKTASRAGMIDFTFTPEQLTVRLGYEVHPEFDLKDFSSYSFTRSVYTIDDAAVEKEINLILKGHGTMVSVDEAATATDTVIGDVVKLTEEGEEGEGKTENHHFNLEYLPEDNPFGKAIAGKKAGETVVVETPGQNEGDAPVNFRVTISEVKRMELPELTDELVKEITGQRFENVADFKADVKIQLDEHFSMKSEEDLLESISAKLIDENPVATPKTMVASFSNMLVENAKRQMGGSFPKAFDTDQFQTAMQPNAERHARWLVISQKIAEMNNLEIDEAAIREYAEKEAAKNTAMNAEELMKTYMSADFRDYVTDTITKEKIYEIIKAKVSITDEATPVPDHRG